MERDLAWLLEDAVADVEPADRLAEIRARVRPSRRRWVYAGGALVAAAATVAVVAVVGGDAPDRALDPVGTPTPSPAPSLHSTPTQTADAPIEGVAPEPVTVYWLGYPPGGESRLFREEREAPAGTSGVDAVLALLQDDAPRDPDYDGNAWSWNPVLGVEVSARRIVVQIEDPATGWAKVALGQMAFSLRAAVDGPVDVVFADPDGTESVTIAADVDELEYLALVQVISPAEGEEVSGSFTASGMASSFEATVPWRLETRDGEVVRQGAATAEGWMDRLYPWQVEVDVSDLDPGTYTFVASTDDPSGGEGPGPTTDTRTVYVR